MTEITDPYERGFIDGMNHQAKSSVDRAVNAMVAEKQEPVAWGNKKGEFRVHKEANEDFKSTAIPFYTHPKLVGLTPEEVSAIWQSMGTWSSTNIQAVYNAIWKAIKEKNSA